MKRFTKSLLVVSMFVGMAIPSWGQATPSTEGKDFWVTFLQAQTKNDAELILTISAKDSCDVLIENPNSTMTPIRRKVKANSSESITITDKNSAYSDANETATNTALHVTATKDISLFAANYINKTFDAANVLPTAALLDDYLIQTYPPSDHDGDAASRGSHFAIVAVEDNTVVDFVLTAKTAKNNTGAQQVTLDRGQVYYVWTGKGAGDAYDLSGTTVKARNGKKIAVFQGCPHTNIPYMVEDRDHIFSQAMPTAYWGSEFGITASRNHRRDIVAVMAINDGTEVYINNEDGDKVLVHTFDFSVDTKHYWTFEMGEEIAWSTSSDSPKYPAGRLPEPLIVDSSCYLTTSCPAGVHLFMVSNRYDNAVAGGSSLSDPAMLWISPIEQVIREINFSTYNKGTTLHFLNILTTTADVSNIVLTGSSGVQSIQNQFYPLTGNSDYSYARVPITSGNYTLKGNVGFLAHVYGYGTRESYAYSCGSSTVQRSVTFNGTALKMDTTYDGKFCVYDTIEMKLNIGNNEYESIEWLFGDGTSYVPGADVPNDKKTTTKHVYTTPGWYDLTVSAVYVNTCTGEQSNGDPMRFSFRVVRPDTVIGEVKPSECVDLATYNANPVYWDSLIANGEIQMSEPEHCYDTVFINMVKYRRETEEYKDTLRAWNEVYSPYNGRYYRDSQDVLDSILNASGCKHFIHYYVDVIKCLDLSFNGNGLSICPGENLHVPYTKSQGDIKDEQGRFVIPGLIDTIVAISNDNTPFGNLELPTKNIKTPGYYTGTLTVEDAKCDTKQEQLHIAVNYPSDIFQLKFNNVLAVYQNKDYQFSAYQWYVNGLPIDGATSSVLYLGKNVIFKEGDVVFVMLTDKNGMTLPSCPQTLSDIDPDMDNEDWNKAPARKMIINSQFVIRKGETDYDIYGQRVR